MKNDRKSGGSALPVWLRDEDKARLEEAMVLAGYRHMSTYIRDQALNAVDVKMASRLAELAEAQAEIEERLGEVDEQLKMLLFLLLRRSTSSDIARLNELMKTNGNLLSQLEG